MMVDQLAAVCPLRVVKYGSEDGTESASCQGVHPK